MTEQITSILMMGTTWIVATIILLFLFIWSLLSHRKTKIALVDTQQLNRTIRTQQQFATEQLEQATEKQQIKADEVEQFVAKVQNQNQDFRNKLLKLKSMYEDQNKKLEATKAQLTDRNPAHQQLLKEKDKLIEELMLADTTKDHQMIHQKAQVNYHYEASVRYQRLFQLSEDKYSNLKQVAEYLQNQLDDYDEHIRMQKFDEVVLAKLSRLILPLRRQINKVDSLISHTPSALEDLKEQERNELIHMNQLVRQQQQEEQERTRTQSTFGFENKQTSEQGEQIQYEYTPEPVPALELEQATAYQQEPAYDYMSESAQTTADAQEPAYDYTPESAQTVEHHQEPVYDYTPDPAQTVEHHQEPVYDYTSDPAQTVEHHQEPVYEYTPEPEQTIAYTQEPVYEYMPEPEQTIAYTQEPVYEYTPEPEQTIAYTQEPVYEYMPEPEQTIAYTQEPVYEYTPEPAQTIVSPQKPVYEYTLEPDYELERDHLKQTEPAHAHLSFSAERHNTFEDNAFEEDVIPEIPPIEGMPPEYYADSLNIAKAIPPLSAYSMEHAIDLSATDDFETKLKLQKDKE